MDSLKWTFWTISSYNSKSLSGEESNFILSSIEIDHCIELLKYGYFMTNLDFGPFQQSQSARF